MTIKLIFCWMLSVSFVLPLSGMNKKVSGAGDVALGTGMAVPGAIMTAFAIAGSSPFAPIAALGIGVTGCGVKIIKDGLEKIFEKKVTVDGKEILIQWNDPSTGNLRYQRYSGTSDVNDFLSNNGFIVAWGPNYPIQKLYDEGIKTINDELGSLKQRYGAPMRYGNVVTINNPELLAAHALEVEDPTSLDAVTHDLAQKKDLFTHLRRIAIYSYGTPSQPDKLSLFTNVASKAMARLMLLTYAAHVYPYEDLLKTERAAKEAAQEEFRNERLERNIAQNNFAAERGVRNQLQTDLNAEQADKARIQERNRLTLAQAVQQSCDIEAQRFDLEEENGGLRQRALRTQENATVQKFHLYQQAAQLEAALHVANNQIEVKDQNSMEVALEAAQIEEENGTLRQQLHALQQQLAQAQEKARRKSQKNKELYKRLHGAQN